MIDEISVYNCRGVRNEIKITEEDVLLEDENGNKAYYIKAPGNYTLNLKKIKVVKDFGYLAGEIGITLQVPIIEGPAGMRFDLPYTIVPETGLLSQQCDAHSGVVERNGRQYCRYCDLCRTAEQVVSDLNSGDFVFLPNSTKDYASKHAECGRIAADEYDLKKTVSLPSRSTLESLIRNKVQGVDEEIEKRLNKGRGRFQVFLNLISAAKPSLSQARWMQSSKDCECCIPGRCDPSYAYCPLEECKSGWALQCLHNTAKIVACYTVEFNYRPRPMQSQFQERQQYRPIPTEQSIPSSQPDKPLNERCVDVMPQRLTHLRRYCTIFWNAKLCCSHCEGIC
ncbi:hypothetical protein WR25_11028 [Diploscapter pachys]|uniref:Uncharacterized protein n=1 Tax=Diploscapter pachys TaxID=2018661 RepID=A0A2A2K2N7_9BILA|nr:hypothetical protein WR25_11028 [Diploscapter pachys]